MFAAREKEKKNRIYTPIFVDQQEFVQREECNDKVKREKKIVDAF